MLLHNKKIVVVAGEESSDQHAASFIRQLNAAHPGLQFSGVGGQHMQDAGVELISDLAKYGATGISEVVRHLGTIRQAFRAIKAHLRDHKPDLLVLVDSPGFNLPLAKFAKKTLGIRVLYYISPQIWAWKANRIHSIKKYVDQMAVIFPFEKKLYEQAGIPVAFVGHPLTNVIVTKEPIDTIRKRLGLPLHQPILAMLPGSRRNEIERHMPVLIETVKILLKSFPSLHTVIPVAETIAPSVISAYFKDSNIPHTLIKGEAQSVLQSCDCAVVASGTASLECALLQKPMCIIYKASFITYLAAAKLIRVKYLGLCNLLQNKMIVPELLQYDCNPLELARVLTDLLTDPDVSHRMSKRLQKLSESLSTQQADCSIATLIENQIMQKIIAD